MVFNYVSKFHDIKAVVVSRRWFYTIITHFKWCVVWIIWIKYKTKGLVRVMRNNYNNYCSWWWL